MNQEITQNECSCDVCKGMCKHRPCTTTPSETIELIKAGFIAKLAMDQFELKIGIQWKTIKAVLPAVKGFEANRNPFFGQCTFLTDDSKCQIHGKLKPNTGKFATHQIECTNKILELQNETIKEWKKPIGQEITEWFEKAMVAMYEGEKPPELPENLNKIFHEKKTEHKNTKQPSRQMNMMRQLIMNRSLSRSR